jgi:threonine synthase
MVPALIDCYRAHLPVTDTTPVISLREGGTPLVEAPSLAQAICGGGGSAAGRVRLYLKIEGANPTGSFKDRGMTVAVSKAVEAGSRAVICASTGNTSASAAAYAARAGLRCAVILPHGMIALGKLSQALMHGATVVAIEGNFDAALAMVRQVAAARPVAVVNSINPHRLEGQKTAAFEICDDLGDAPRYHCIPVGNAGNITAYWKGYREYRELGRTTRTPRMLGFQAAGAAPIVLGRVIERPETVATAIRIGNPASWKGAVEAKTESGGRIEAVSDEEILEAYRLLARTEGVFCEPASAASVAGFIRLWQEGAFASEVEPDVVCTLTGHGLKDPHTALSAAAQPIVLPAELDRVLDAIGL